MCGECMICRRRPPTLQHQLTRRFDFSRGMSGDASTSAPTAGFASRRPDWSLPKLRNDLKLDSHEALEKFTGRQQCPKCNKSRSLYCYDCLVPFTHVPSIVLPFHVNIITHIEERAANNTGRHAALLCPQQVSLHDVLDCPTLSEQDKARCIVLFPSDDAIFPSDLEPGSIDRVFVIDSRWQKAIQLNTHVALRGIRRVKLATATETKSSFWRFHTEGIADEGVCTIECLHLLMRELVQANKIGSVSDDDLNQHSFDNLLWYFSFLHQRVEKTAIERASRGGERKSLVLGGVNKKKKSKQ